MINEIQSKIGQLVDKGWTLAAIADELGVTSDTVELWKAGKRNPTNAKAVLLMLDKVLGKKRIPKKKRYKRYRKFFLGQQVEANTKAPGDYEGREGIITDIRLEGRTIQYGVRFNPESGKADEGYFDSWMLDPKREG